MSKFVAQILIIKKIYGFTFFSWICIYGLSSGTQTQLQFIRWTPRHTLSKQRLFLQLFIKRSCWMKQFNWQVFNKLPREHSYLPTEEVMFSGREIGREWSLELVTCSWKTENVCSQPSQTLHTLTCWLCIYCYTPVLGTGKTQYLATASHEISPTKDLEVQSSTFS